jgi:hypothetical protein
MDNKRPGRIARIKRSLRRFMIMARSAFRELRPAKLRATAKTPLCRYEISCAKKHGTALLVRISSAVTCLCAFALLLLLLRLLYLKVQGFQPHEDDPKLLFPTYLKIQFGFLAISTVFFVYILFLVSISFSENKIAKLRKDNLLETFLLLPICNAEKLRVLIVAGIWPIMRYFRNTWPAMVGLSILGPFYILLHENYFLVNNLHVPIEANISFFLVGGGIAVGLLALSLFVFGYLTISLGCIVMFCHVKGRSRFGRSCWILVNLFGLACTAHLFPLAIVLLGIRHFWHLRRNFDYWLLRQPGEK